MLIPVRCFTCGALVGSKYETFKQKVMDGNSPDDVLDELVSLESAKKDYGVIINTTSYIIDEKATKLLRHSYNISQL